MSSTIVPTIPHMRILSPGIYALLETISTKISENFEIYGASDSELSDWTRTLCIYLTKHNARRMRRSRNLLNAANLSFHVLRTCNPSETTIDDKGKKVKGEKNWYYFILAETEEGTGNVQTLAEGGLVKYKEDLLETFMKAVEEKVEAWQKQDEEKEA